ncbi:hypothetical protein FisN_10Hh017 [Fistulifera solaris]|uniref:Uncharacterized protein n=1 Tax=Fistulifera solaris TaxID=1519565 RepID=A0A1Z5K5E4_FISSO|nr:hypothetical protein FisN_10Hh017 [Fistulifera solaris]|eukprot:GAX21439.1 hypothetical protein FisN_10Hh017 [Fistulifera solaris]
MLQLIRTTLFYRCFLASFVIAETASTNNPRIEDSWPKQQQHPFEEPFQNDRYIQFLQGCYQTYGEALCDAREQERIALNAMQPALQTNFTSNGYTKVRLSDAAFLLLQDFWDLHSSFESLEQPSSHPALRTEVWNRGSMYVNHWEAPTKVLSFENTEAGLMPGDVAFLQQEVQSAIAKWSGVSTLTPTLMYGIRVYERGSILVPHVDRLPLVLSAIINVAQDVEEDWPLEIVGHDGIPVNVTMQPEQEIFQKDNQSTNRRADEATLLRQKYEQALSQWDESNAVSPGTKRQDLPLHIQEGTLEATRWRQEFVFVKEETPQKSNNNVNEKNDSQKTHNINRLAARGALDAIRELAQTDPAILQQRDANHWQAIHEAARAGQTQVVEYLIQKGVDLNTRTNNGNGGTALWWAEHMLPSNHKTIKLLRDNGAVSIAPSIKNQSEK